MIITYHGKQFLKLQYGDTVIAVNPVEKASSSVAKVTRFGADVVLSSNAHPDFSGIETVTFGGKTPFVIDGPGEYEIGGMAVYGFASLSEITDYPVNTIYLFEIDSMRVCILGAHGAAELPQEVKSALGDVDIVITPIGGQGVIGASQAAAITKKMGAKMIIPVDYGKGQDSDALKVFLKETGSDAVPESKLTIKRKDISGKEGVVFVLREE